MKKSENKFHLHDGIFKYWVILVKVISDLQRTQRLYPKDILYDTYINYILLQKSESEIIEVTKMLCDKFNIKENKKWFWEYSQDLHYLTESERFVWLFAEIKKLLLKEDKDTREIYLRKFDKDFLELFQDAELFD